ncbi:unnamed protein product [Vitrella brassicaformis CCMP3155]|uniref:Uncharacterized protein n=2 Tax=Vitrella brassicaformis TaxID=1169539 RepID=A0A0G4EEG8_VITBC|nr:unnamed protein product [Vitrella brassicaformis CCMP3155]|eukprot:CEL94394.1 unnamed protein product [Vitrella brassicaformis CCMP3155]
MAEDRKRPPVSARGGLFVLGAPVLGMTPRLMGLFRQLDISRTDAEDEFVECIEPPLPTSISAAATPPAVTNTPEPIRLVGTCQRLMSKRVGRRLKAKRYSSSLVVANRGGSATPVSSKALDTLLQMPPPDVAALNGDGKNASLINPYAAGGTLSESEEGSDNHDPFPYGQANHFTHPFIPERDSTIPPMCPGPLNTRHRAQPTTNNVYPTVWGREKPLPREVFDQINFLEREAKQAAEKGDFQNAHRLQQLRRHVIDAQQAAFAEMVRIERGLPLPHTMGNVTNISVQPPGLVTLKPADKVQQFRDALAYMESEAKKHYKLIYMPDRADTARVELAAIHGRLRQLLNSYKHYDLPAELTHQANVLKQQLSGFKQFGKSHSPQMPKWRDACESSRLFLTTTYTDTDTDADNAAPQIVKLQDNPLLVAFARCSKIPYDSDLLLVQQRVAKCAWPLGEMTLVAKLHLKKTLEVLIDIGTAGGSQKLADLAKTIGCAESVWLLGPHGPLFSDQMVCELREVLGAVDVEMVKGGGTEADTSSGRPAADVLGDLIAKISDVGGGGGGVSIQPPSPTAVPPAALAFILNTNTNTNTNTDTANAGNGEAAPHGSSPPLTAQALLEFIQLGGHTTTATNNTHNTIQDINNTDTGGSDTPSGRWNPWTSNTILPTGV